MGGGASKAPTDNISDSEPRATPERLQWQDATKLFHEIDADSDGHILSAELTTCLEAHGYPAEVAATLISELDFDSDSQISFDEWRRGFYTSSLCAVKQPVGEDFADLLSKKSGCEIAETAERAMSVEQLQRVQGHIKRRCAPEGWADISGNVLAPAVVSLYECCRYVIKPSTYTRQCSFVELVAREAQPPTFFTSHWWGEPVYDFVRCVEAHAADRGKCTAHASNRKYHASYWVCAYANNQHDIAADLAEDPAQSSFRRALDASEGTLSILDRKGVVFKRIWCAYELYVSLTAAPAQKASFTWDVYTALPLPKKGARGEQPLAVGLLDSKGSQEDAQGKRRREADFPFKLIESSLKLACERADASVTQDKVRILNTIVGDVADLLAPPAASHPKYANLNGTLRSRFAVAGLRAALLKSKVSDFLPFLSSGELLDVSLDFGGVKQFGQGKTAEKIAQALPATLQNITLNADDGITSFLDALPALPNLTALDLSNTGCGVDGALALAKAKAARPGLRVLNLTNCKLDDPAISKLAGALLKVTTSFHLNLSTTYGVFGGGPVSSIGGVPVYNDDQPGNRFGSPKRNGAAVKALGKLAGKGALSELSLCRNDIEEDGVKLGEALLAANDGCKLVSLDLSDTHIDVKGAVAIFEWLGANASLMSLVMTSSAGGERGGGLLNAAAATLALGKALQANASLTHLDISGNGQLDVRWREADAAHTQDPDDPASAIAVLCAGVAAHPTLTRLHMLGAGKVCAAYHQGVLLGTEVRDTGPRLASAVLANPRIESFGEVPVGVLRADAVGGDLKLVDGRVGCAEGWVLTKLLAETQTATSLKTLTLVGRDAQYNERYETLGGDRTACEALREACKGRSPEVRFFAHQGSRPDGYPK